MGHLHIIDEILSSIYFYFNIVDGRNVLTKIRIIILLEDYPNISKEKTDEFINIMINPLFIVPNNMDNCLDIENKLEISKVNFLSTIYNNLEELASNIIGSELIRLAM